jgi:hypothetical protein
MGAERKGRVTRVDWGGVGDKARARDKHDEGARVSGGRKKRRRRRRLPQRRGRERTGAARNTQRERGTREKTRTRSGSSCCVFEERFGPGLSAGRLYSHQHDGSRRNHSKKAGLRYYLRRTIATLLQ